MAWSLARTIRRRSAVVLVAIAGGTEGCGASQEQAGAEDAADDTTDASDGDSDGCPEPEFDDEEVPAGCFTGCVQDADPAQPGLQPECVVLHRFAEMPATQVPECLAGPTVPDGDDWCFVYRTRDVAGCQGALSGACYEEGWNLELDVIDADPEVEHGQFEATCLLSAEPEADCPQLFD